MLPLHGHPDRRFDTGMHGCIRFNCIAIYMPFCPCHVTGKLTRKLTRNLTRRERASHTSNSYSTMFVFQCFPLTILIDLHAKRQFLFQFVLILKLNFIPFLDQISSSGWIVPAFHLFIWHCKGKQKHSIWCALHFRVLKIQSAAPFLQHLFPHLH